MFSPFSPSSFTITLTFRSAARYTIFRNLYCFDRVRRARRVLRESSDDLQHYLQPTLWVLCYVASFYLSTFLTSLPAVRSRFLYLFCIIFDFSNIWSNQRRFFKIFVWRMGVVNCLWFHFWVFQKRNGNKKKNKRIKLIFRHHFWIFFCCICKWKVKTLMLYGSLCN